MEEKVLIKSYSSKKTKLFFIGVIIALLALSLIFLILMIKAGRQNWAERGLYITSYWGFYECDLCGERFTTRSLIPTHMLEFHSDKMTVDNFVSLPWLYFLYGGIILAVVFYLIYFLLSRCNITVTDKNINGRTFWGKKVVLPIHMVSAYSTSKIFSVLSITTSSGFIKFPCIGNYEEISVVLQQLLNKRQKRTETQEALILQEKNSNNLNDLVRLKNLLDNGIITQEEFDEKKKQLLNL